MYLIDYHIHSNNSFDSKESVTAICESAIAKGINEICFTEHFSVKEGLKTYGYIDLKKYYDEINYCKELFNGKLVIKIGLELCEPNENEEELTRCLHLYNFDFILGSVHNFDYNTSLARYLRENSKFESYSRYFKEIDKLASSPHVDVIGHFDLMKTYAFDIHGNYDFADYVATIEDILKNIIAKGKGIEVNTSSLRTLINEPMPSIDILKLYYELGGKIITIGSDSHKAEDVGEGIKEIVKILKSIGFTDIYSFEKRKPIAVRIG